MPRRLSMYSRFREQRVSANTLPQRPDMNCVKPDVEMVDADVCDNH